MKIFKHFLHINLTSDQRNSLEKLTYFLESGSGVFMLKGYAGTGKTTLIKGLIGYLKENNLNFEVMAPTGRAAKILRAKTEYGKTIHSCIYQLQDIAFSSKEDNNKDENFRIIFPLKKLENRESVLIIDEASMISSRVNKHPYLQFGSEILLQDILTYSQIHTLKTKIIFVGDPAQLPPVGDNKSWAFESSLFVRNGISVTETELKEVKRQENNLILKNAITIRKKIEEDSPKELMLEYDELSFSKLDTQDFVNKYINELPSPELGNGVIIAFSNAQCFHYNNAIREYYFPYQNNITVGDIIQITQNNTSTYSQEVFNGDFAKIIRAESSIKSISAPVWTEINGERIKKSIELAFRKVEILLDSSMQPMECLIVDSLLHSTNSDLSLEESKAIYINFIMRFDEEQKISKEQGLPIIKRYSKEFKKIMLADPYLNAIRCKYGYAITCHKAQGGEWDKVFIDYSGRVSLKTDPLRWSYTATTRAKNSCYVVNPPHFNYFSNFRISSIGQISKIPSDAFSFDKVPVSPFHQPGQHLCKSQKYWIVADKLKEIGFEITNIISRDYLERYSLSNGNMVIQIEGNHNGAGVFMNGFRVISNIDNEDLKNKIEQIFNLSKSEFTVRYNPSNDILKELYSLTQELTDDLEITITNIVEQVDSYYVTYFLRTDSISSKIQFYFDKNGNLTVAIPQTFKCIEDKKLESLLNKLKENVI